MIASHSLLWWPSRCHAFIAIMDVSMMCHITDEMGSGVMGIFSGLAMLALEVLQHV